VLLTLSGAAAQGGGCKGRGGAGAAETLAGEHVIAAGVRGPAARGAGAQAPSVARFYRQVCACEDNCLRMH
jgi:hypothetical protein